MLLPEYRNELNKSHDDVKTSNEDKQDNSDKLLLNKGESINCSLLKGSEIEVSITPVYNSPTSLEEISSYLPQDKEIISINLLPSKANNVLGYESQVSEWLLMVTYKK